MADDRGMTIIAGGEGFVTPYLYKALTSDGGRCRIVDFSTSLSLQRERMATYERRIGPGADVVFADPTYLGRDPGLFDGAGSLINLSDIFSDLDYEAFPAEGLKLNAKAALEIMEQVSEAGVKRVVHISSGVVYGPRRTQPVPESIPREAHDLQAAFKITAESIVESFGRRGKAEIVVLRLFNVYGPGQPEEAIVPYIVRGALSRKPLPMGNTNHTRDFLYIDDLVSGVVAAIDTPDATGKVMNLASGEETSIKALIGMVEKITATKIEVSFDPDRIRIDKPDFPRFIADIALARETLGFTPSVKLEDGLARTIKSLKEAPGGWQR